jgi:Tfp pilus assembly protein PilF
MIAQIARLSLLVAAIAGLTSVCTAPAAADDFDTCYKESGDLAISACTRAIASGNYSGQSLAEIFNNRGSEYISKSDFNSAISDFDNAIKLDRNYPYAFQNRCIAYQSRGNKGDDDQAISDCTNALQLNANLQKAFNTRGNAYSRMNDYKNAIADYNEAIRLAPTNPLAYNNRGNAFRDTKSYEKAHADYDKAITLDAAFTAAFTNRGLCSEQEGDTARAIADFRQALAVPAKYDNGKWAQDTAREHLKALGRPEN